MTYLEQLLDGAEVEWRPLNEVFEIRTGYTPSKKNSAFWDGGTIPWFRMEDLRTHGGLLSDAIQHITPQAIKSNELFKAGSIILATSATIGEHALLLTDALANQRFTNFNLQGAFADRVLPKFAYYYFFKIDAWCKEHVFTGTFPSVDMKNLRKQLFPLPPLAVQERIVEILDKFTALIEALETELELRTRQYEYYRNRLLRFGKEVEWKPLGEVAELKRGTSITQNTSTEGCYPVISGGRQPAYYVDQFNRTGETITVAGSGAYAGFLQYWNEPIFVGDAFSIKPDPSLLLTRFVYFFLLKQQQKLHDMKVGGAVPHVYTKFVAPILIPLPPLAVQEQIVAILDKFYTLVHSISEGLPAEIALRRRQYEYYRNLLLRFPFP